MINREEMAQKSGEGSYRIPKRIRTDVYRIHGETGKFQFVASDDKDWNWSNVGDELKLIFIRPRRQLVDYNGGMRTIEHNYTGDYVTLFMEGGREKGIAKELREKYPSLKTEQIMYCLKDGEIVKLIVKGSSLGSENKADTTTAFYDYFAEFGSNEHIWEYETEITAVEEMSKARKTYYAMNFKKGRKLSDDELESVSNVIDKLHTYFEEQDRFNELDKTKTVVKSPIKTGIGPGYNSKASEELSQEVEEKIPEISLDDEIKPEDLPF